MVTQTSMDQERQRWADLSQGILDGSHAARNEFFRRYSPGVRAVLRRQVGAVGLERLVSETLDGALLEIEQGKIREPRDLVRFVRNVAGRTRRLRAHPQPARPVGSPAVLSLADRTAIRERIQAADKALAAFTPVEREILICYYARGFTRQDIECEFDMPAAEFELLRDRLVEALAPYRKRRAPKGNPLPQARRAAAGNC
jgi:DNA-directed RNA polymerase specialized sigma24 family protein